MRCLITITLIALGLCGCSDSNRAPSSTNAQGEGSNATVDRNNTAVNERDRDDNAKTPIDQNENQADIDITANIRKKVVDTKMSVDAQNVKIITQDGRVTLRGPVKSADEKKQIEDFATSVAGADKVESQIEVEQ